MSEPIDTATLTREQAIRYVLLVLRSPMALMSPDRTEALMLAKKYQITAEDLLTVGRRASQNA